MAYHIWTDTSANLPAPLCKKLGIGVLPFHFIHNGGAEQCCLDTDAFPYDAYYEDLKNGGVATTSMINSEAYREIFEREAAAGNDVLYIGMSSGISGSYQSAVIAVSPTCSLSAVVIENGHSGSRSRCRISPLPHAQQSRQTESRNRTKRFTKIPRYSNSESTYGSSAIQSVGSIPRADSRSAARSPHSP